MMIGAETVAVGTIGQDLDDPAIADASLAAAVDHPFEFALECLEAGDLAPHLLKLSSGDAVHSGARSFGMICQRQELTDRGQWKPELAGMAQQKSGGRWHLYVYTQPARVRARKPWSTLPEMESFLLELGVGFTFVARQKRIQIDGDDFHPPANKDKMRAGIPLVDDDDIPF